MTLPNFVSISLFARTPAYDDFSIELGNINAEIKAIYHNKKFPRSTSEIPENALFGIILDRTNFYAESGGQEYDTGSIVVDGKADTDVTEFEVSNVQVFNGFVLHIGRLKSGALEVGHKVVSSYDEVSDVSSSANKY